MLGGTNNMDTSLFMAWLVCLEIAKVVLFLSSYLVSSERWYFIFLVSQLGLGTRLWVCIGLGLQLVLVKQ